MVLVVAARQYGPISVLERREPVLQIFVELLFLSDIRALLTTIIETLDLPMRIYAGAWLWR